MSQVNPSILTWARETAGLSPEKAVKKLGLRSTREMEPKNRLATLETGEANPTRSMLSKMAKSYRRPLSTFYLDAPPLPCEWGTDFRTFSVERAPDEEAVVFALVRNVVARQGLIRSCLAEDEVEVLPFIQSIKVANGKRHALRALEEVVGIRPGAMQSPRSFEELREAAEQKGIFVLLQGDLGSYHTKLRTHDFKAFAVADPVAPFIVINSYDVRPNWSFTLIHQLVHLLLGQTGICGVDSDMEVETFCNNVASEYLFPADVIGTFHHHHKEELQRRLKEEEGSPSFYVMRRRRIGIKLQALVKSWLREGTVSSTKAALILGVKPTQVGKVLNF